MDGLNAQGRTVSLLNEDLPRLSNLTSLSSKQSPTFPTSLNNISTHYSPPRLHHQPSSFSSDSSTNPYSPGSNPPSLSRSDSSDSAAGQTPSPLTPTSTGFDTLHELRHNLPRKFSSTREGLPSLSSLRLQAKIPSSTSSSASSMDYNLPQAPLPSDYAFAHATAPTLYDPLVTTQLTPSTTVGFEQAITAPQSIPDATPTQAVFPTPINTQRTSTKKNSYPCPLSKQYNCAEFFTTSGHAARHAKKHTGKKDAICPECGKGFTRKDNMEQHRRTHSGNRNKANGHSSDSSPAKTIPNKDSEETKARQKVRQQHRKSRPGSMSANTQPPPPVMTPVQQQPLFPVSTIQQPMPMTSATSMLPPQGDMLDPILREQNLAGFMSPTMDLGMGFGMPLQTGQIGQLQNFPAPQAPMSLMSASRNRSSSSPQALSPGATKQVSPSVAPLSAAGMDKLDILAEASSRRSSE